MRRQVAPGKWLDVGPAEAQSTRQTYGAARIGHFSPPKLAGWSLITAGDEPVSKDMWNKSKGKKAA